MDINFNYKFDGHNMRISKLHMAMMVELWQTSIDNVAYPNELDHRAWNSQPRIEKAIANGFINFNGHGYFITEFGKVILENTFGKMKGHYAIAIWNEVSTY